MKLNKINNKQSNILAKMNLALSTINMSISNLQGDNFKLNKKITQLESNTAM